MAASTSAHDDDGITGINITPLVDITLVLLVVFMVCAKLIASQGIPLDLPKAAGGGATQTMLTVSVDPQGHTFADGQPITSDAELRKRAVDALAQNKELRTVIQAAGSVSHGAVIHVMDELQQAGISKIAFAVDPTRKSQPQN